jgi:HD-GYP domain-containing protein (c-di-GMP phosphodiesterase class II)
MSDNLVTTEVSAPPNLYPGFVNVSLRSLLPDSLLPCELRLEAWAAQQQQLRLVTALAPGAKVNGAWLKHLLNEDVKHGFIAMDDLDNFQDYLLANMNQVLTDQDPRRGHYLAYEQALCSIKSAMLDPRNGRRLARGATTVRQIMGTFWEDDKTRQGLLRVLTSDKQLYTHSLNATLLGAGFAHFLGWNRKQAEHVGIALFFHDLGLMEGNEGNPNQPALCRHRNEADMHFHPQATLRFLSQVPGLAREVLEIVLNHHENLDGSGYPRRRKSYQLNPAARLARMVDFYESATSGCGGLEVVSPFVALRQMRFDMAAQLDQDMLEHFVRFLGHI